MHVDTTDASSLYQAIKAVLVRSSLPKSKCRRQGYDGASDMMGHLTRVATRIQQEEPKFIVLSIH